MSPQLIFLCLLIYSVILFIAGRITSKKANNDSFYLGNKSSPWYIVAYGMIGASISGVTFVSVPGDVYNSSFSYMLVVAGYLFGYIVIANILMPMYYKLNLTSIYSYLDQRFGNYSYKTGASFFILSRMIGASFRMFLVINILQIFVFDKWNIPFGITTALFIGLILLYTYKGGIKTIIWTDTIQTTLMLLGVVVTIFIIKSDLNISLRELFVNSYDSPYSQLIITEWQSKGFYLKQFFSGIFITIVMTGLDQDMMQKNLSCRNIKEAKKNMYWMSSALVPVNLLFMTLGLILYYYAETKGIALPTFADGKIASDNLFPQIAFNNLGTFAGLTFIIGILAAAYSSADGALTALTTSFAIDILGLPNKKHLNENQKIKRRYVIHALMAIAMLGVIMLFKAINDNSVIQALFTIAGYTYGPLLGLYSFGLFTKRKLIDNFVPYIAIASPIICYILSANSEAWFAGYKFGFELLILNGLLTFAGLFAISNKK